MTKKTTKKAGTDVGSFTALQRAEQDGTLTMEDKLRLLYQLQQTDSQIDKIHLLRGELPLKFKIWKTISKDLPPVWKTCKKKSAT